jgi:uncharacterized linocin/CFP29 family protein
MTHWELDSEQLRRTGWTAIWNDIKNKVREEAGRLRKVRSLLPLFGDQTTDPDALFDYRTNPIDRARPMISIDPSRQRLVSAELRAEFRLAPEQYSDVGVAMALVSRAASRIGAAEDALLLHGEDAGPALAVLNVAHRNLDKQESRLFPAGLKPVNGPILDLIVNAIGALQMNGHYGGYGVIVAPNLYQQAFKAENARSDAPIHQIRPLLVEDGFRYSNAAPPGTGVVVSLGGDVINVAAPRDASCGFIREDNGAILCVAERIRLLVNDPTAIAPLVGDGKGGKP